MQLHLYQKDSVCSSTAPCSWLVSVASPGHLVHSFSQQCPFQCEDCLQGKKCLSASVPAAHIFFTYVYVSYPIFLHLLTAFLLMPVIYYNFPGTFIINLPKLFLQLKRICTWHKSTQLLVHRSHPRCAEILFSSFWEIRIC